MTLKNPHIRILLLIIIILLMGNLNALVDAVLHPEIPFFDHEHLVVGTVSATLSAILYGLLLAYANRQEKLLQQLQRSQNELERRVEERTADLCRQSEELEQEIARRQRSEHSMREATKAAENASRIKSEFMANMSHEIRTPINGIMGMLQLLLGTTTVNEQQRRYLEIARSSIDRLMETINSILDFSNLENGQLQPTATPFSLNAALADCLKAPARIASQKGMVLQWRVDPEIPDALVGDKKFLQQIIENLVGNAIKFSQQGPISMTMHREGSHESDRVTLHCTVTDNGPGIALEKQKDIFAPFAQIDGSLTRPQEGTGLGLTICAKLVALLGGAIWLKSEPGHGASFHFTATFDLAPQQRAPQQTAAIAATQPEDEAKVHILLAEDDPINRFVIEEIIARRPWRLTTVTNGQQALDAFRTHHFDLVLMDVQMPEMDGLTATTEIRRLEEAAGAIHTPIVALTAHALENDRQRCLAAGMDEHLTKPILPDALLAAVDRHLHRPPAAPSSLSA